MKTAPQVYLVEDDESVRKSVVRLLRVAGHQVEAYASGEEFLENGQMAEYGCIILDLRLPGMCGESFQERLRTVEKALPIVVITGHGDGPIRDKMMKKGAVAFLDKPFHDQDLLDAIELALSRNREEVQERSEA
jgi:FixJ family two-component response regulator